MGKIRALAAVLSILFVLVASVASSRVLLDDEKVSHSPFPNSVNSTKSDHSELSLKPPPNPDNPTGPGSSTFPPPPSKPDGGQTKKDDGSEGNPNNSKNLTDTSKEDPAKSGTSASKSKEEDKGGSVSPTKPKNNSVGKVVKETCDSSSNICHYETLVACLQHSKEDPKNLSLLVQNEGVDAFSVHITGKPDLHIDEDVVSLIKGSSKKINLPIDDWNVAEIVLNAGRGDCIIHSATPASNWNFFQPFPVYEIRLTPIYGVYLLVVTMVLVGGTWACCRFRKRGNKDGSGVPYQQLEMGAQPESSSAVDSKVDGWDDWDDDWDDEAVMRPSEKHTTASVSSNGLTSRTPKKDGWDADWDD